ncbi:ribonuclease T2 [Litoreibacter meonggei]|uniref:Ribonuclease T2 n=1 Tax=Litoreibacter meonggei TaxID=1049199 RepID=A0A497WQU4_9RHOB|nr:ribonuclease T2 [Litoreibacter meonggei]RLJ51734.1 ribonuclease T2 [Litoreibacter meonggei]
MRMMLLGLLIWGSPLWAEGERAGKFDYFVLSLSWSPNWCALEGDARGADQCDNRHDYGWTLHGLWPQNERGWPSYCRTAERDPSRGQTKAMTDIMGSGGLAWHQWKKHGRCTGLSASDYFELSRKAYSGIVRPPVFRKLTKPVTLPAKVVEEAFLEANPTLSPEMITITCKKDRIQEVRICLTKSLSPRQCGKDSLRDCTLRNAAFAPIR